MKKEERKHLKLVGLEIDFLISSKEPKAEVRFMSVLILLILLQKKKTF